MGYTGGAEASEARGLGGGGNGVAPRPTYASVCAGDGHSEALRVEYDPARVSYTEVLGAFWGMHDGRVRKPAQYASAVFVEGDAQLAEARTFLEARESESLKPVATRLRRAEVRMPD